MLNMFEKQKKDGEMKNNMKKLYQHSEEFRQKVRLLSSNKMIYSSRKKARNNLVVGSFEEISNVLETNWFGLYQLYDLATPDPQGNRTALY